MFLLERKICTLSYTCEEFLLASGYAICLANPFRPVRTRKEAIIVKEKTRFSVASNIFKKRKELSFSAKVVPRGLAIGAGPYTALHNGARL